MADQVALRRLQASELRISEYVNILCQNMLEL